MQPAVNPLPAAVVALAVVIFGVECLFWLAGQGFIQGSAGIGMRIGAIENYAFYGAVLDWMLETGRYEPELLVRFVTYPFLSFGFTQAVFVCVFILAIGKMVGEAFGNIAVLVVFFGASIGGALAYGLLLNNDFPLVGGFPGVYGLIGGYTFLMWVRSRAMGQNPTRAFSLIAMLLGIQLVFGVLFGTGMDWVADLTGFLCGFGLSFLLVPGGWTRLREFLRSR